MGDRKGVSFLIGMTAAVLGAIAAGQATRVDAAFPGENGPVVFEQAAGVYLMNPDGADQRKITDGGEPGFSADGKLITFARGGRKPGIYSAHIDGTGVRRITRRKGDTQPAISPNRKRFAFTNLFGRGGGRRQKGIGLFVTDASGKNLRAIGHGTGNAGNPEFSPNGRKIIFDVQGANHGIYVIDANGRHQRRLTGFGNKYGTPVTPDFSPNGRKIIFADAFGGPIHIMDSNGKHHRVLRTLPDDSRPGSPVYDHPAFSPDGKQIVVGYKRLTGPGIALDGSGEIYTMKADGTDAVKIAGDDSLVPEWGRLP